MRQDTRSADETERDPAPPDIETMRESARLLLAEDVGLPVLDDLDALVLALREHIQLLIPEVAKAAAREPKNSIPRYCALACLGEARNKLRLGSDGTLPIRLASARKLARVLNALCDHYENLSQYPAASR
jgi:hypothetical protein